MKKKNFVFKKESFKKLIPIMVEEVKFRLKNGDEDIAMVVFEVFNVCKLGIYF